ncbi:MAG: hypothetical protein VST70_00130 [Nitrospirota bacterium]|nr:hypothetical protein [Nitrospirota bacterium]
MRANFCRLTLISLAFMIPTLVLAPSLLRAETPVASSSGSRDGVTFTVVVSLDAAGKAPDIKSITYTMTPEALRIDAPGEGTGKSYIWNLATRTVASLDNEKHTYHSDSLNKIMGFVDFSQLLGQYAGNNPKDSVTVSSTPETVAGISCRKTTRLHHFKGRVVGMINGDQTITQCLADTFPGVGIYQAFQKGLAALSQNSSKEGPRPQMAPLSLETIRTTDYSPGFLVKLLASLHLYDLSRVPGRQIEKETVQSLLTRSVPDSFFSIPSSYARETTPAKP